MCEIQCLVALREDQQACNLIRNIFLIEQTSHSLNISLKEEAKIICTLSKCLKNLNKLNEAVE